MENEQNLEGAQENTSVTPPQQEVDWKAKAAELDAEVKKLKAIQQRHAEKKLKESAESDSSEKPRPQEDVSEKFKDIEERVNLRLQGYEPDEVTEIADVARAKKISLTEAVNLPFVKKAIEGLRAEKKATSDSASPSNRVAVYKGKTFQEVLKDPNSSATDKQAAYEAVLGKRRINQST